MRRLVITSDEIKNNTNNLGITDTNYQTIDMVQPVVGLREFGVARVGFSKSWNTINDTNDWFQIGFGGSYTDINMTHGNYDINEFMTMLQTVIDDAFSGTGLAYTVTENKGYITFTLVTNTTGVPVHEMILAFGFVEGEERSNASYKVLGFQNNTKYEESDVAEPVPLTAPLIFNLTGGNVKMYLDFPELNSQKSENFNSSADENHLFESIPVGGNTGEYEYYEPQDVYVHKIDYSINLTKITPQFYWVHASKKYPVNFNGQPFEIICYYSTKLSRKEDANENYY